MKDVADQFLELAEKIAPAPAFEDIRVRAHEIWLQARLNGSPEANAEGNWLQAELELRNEKILQLGILLYKSMSPLMQELSAQLVEMSSEHDVTLADAISSHLRDEDIREDYLLTDNLKFYRNFGDRQIVVLEEKPKLRTLYMDLRFNHPQIGSHTEGSFGKGNDYSQHVTLALPYVVYVVNTMKNRDSGYSYTSMHLAFSNVPLKNLKQTVTVPLLPNMGSNEGHATHLCCRNLSSSQLTPMEVAQDVITKFWQTQFNYMLYRPKHMPKQFSTFEEWAEKSKENPLFCLEVDWPGYAYPLSSTLNLDNQGRVGQLKKVIAENKRTYITEIRKLLANISALQQTLRVV